MPYINIEVSTSLNKQQRNTLSQKTTRLMHTIMRKNQDVTVVHIHESKPTTWSVGGTVLSDDQPNAAYVNIKVTQGTNTPNEKADMIAHMMQLLVDVIGTLQEACYVVIDDIPANSWGYNGLTQAQRAAEKR